MSLPRTIPMGEFEMVYTRWEDYVAGRFPRYKLRDLTKNSTYIVSILHWLPPPRVGVALPLQIQMLTKPRFA
jgi:hypothetical protein